MYRYKDVTIRKFTFDDISKKIEWINNPQNNRYLHYDLPLEYEKTCQWFEHTKDRADRYDAVIEYMGQPVGLIGLLDIDYKNRRAEEYLVIGETSFKNKGIAFKSGNLLMLYAFYKLNLNKVYAYIEVKNNPILKLDTQKRNYKIEGMLKEHILINGKYIDVYYIGALKNEFCIPENVCLEEL